MPKIKQSVNTQVYEDGKLTTKRTNQTLSWGDEPIFIKLYLNDVLYLKDMPKSNTPVLYELLKYMTYANSDEGQIICINGFVKDKVAKAIGYKVQTVSNCISAFVKAELLIRIGTGTYLVNPYFFGKGDWQDISRLRLQINYDDIKGRTFQTVCEYKDKKSNNIPGQMNMDDLCAAATGTEG